MTAHLHTERHYYQHRYFVVVGRNCQIRVPNCLNFKQKSFSQLLFANFALRQKVENAVARKFVNVRIFFVCSI